MIRRSEHSASATVLPRPNGRYAHLLRFRITVCVLVLSSLASLVPFAWLVTVTRFLG